MSMGSEQVQVALVVAAATCLCFWSSWRSIALGWRGLKTGRYNFRGRISNGATAERMALAALVYGVCFFLGGCAMLYMLWSGRPMRW
jgi:hypothetical protein